MPFVFPCALPYPHPPQLVSACVCRSGCIVPLIFTAPRAACGLPEALGLAVCTPMSCLPRSSTPLMRLAGCASGLMVTPAERSGRHD